MKPKWVTTEAKEHNNGILWVTKRGGCLEKGWFTRIYGPKGVILEKHPTLKEAKAWADKQVFEPKKEQDDA